MREKRREKRKKKEGMQGEKKRKVDMVRRDARKKKF